MSRIIVIGTNGTTELEFSGEESLLSVLRDNDISVPASCGGRGKCGKCRLNINGVPRLACKYYPNDGDRVEISDSISGIIMTKTKSEFDLEPGRAGISAAVDLGTTTIAVRIINRKTGKEQHILSEWNQQASYGGDVINRIQYIMDDSENLKRLSSIVRTQVWNMIDSSISSCGEKLTDLKEICVAGNTVMQHIFAEISPAGIAVAPFTPESLFENVQDTLNGVPICYAPCVAGYVGGDITSGMLDISLKDLEGYNLFLDIGTNGEMALGGKDGIVTCAVASGPAFEGAGISCGMPGLKGAISHVRYDKGFLYDIIGGGSAKGICGSGLVDMVACLIELGIIDETGCLLPPNEVEPNLAKYLDEDENGNGLFRISEDIYLNALDVRNLQLAKSAVISGINVLMKYKNINYNDISNVFIAGGFGNYIDAKSASKIGMIPEELLDKIQTVGNTSLSGMTALALNSNKHSELIEIKHLCEYIELSGNKYFNEYFVGNLGF